MPNLEANNKLILILTIVNITIYASLQAQSFYQ